MKFFLWSKYLDLKEQGIEFEGQSYLFWEFVRILEEARQINPNVLFLLENVEMGKRWESVFDKALEIKGIHINSALVSAQNRKRIYWTNINNGDIPLPKDKGLVLRDIMEENPDERYFLSDNMVNWLNRHASNRGEENNYVE